MADILSHKKRALHDKAVNPLVRALKESDIGVNKRSLNRSARSATHATIEKAGNERALPMQLL